MKSNQMTITHSCKHTYLRMNFEIVNGKIILEMEPYMEKCIKVYGESITMSAVTPAAKSLMVITKTSQKLDENVCKNSTI